MNNYEKAKDEWIIKFKDYANGYHNCESPSKSRESSLCGDIDRLLRLVKADNNDRRWVCAKHAIRDYKIVGQWANTWQKDFKIAGVKEVSHA